MNFNELNEKRSALIAEARKLYDEHAGNMDDTTSEKIKNLTAEADALEARAKTLAKIEGHEKYLNESRGRASVPSDPELPKEVRSRYSLLRAIDCLTSNKPLDGLEGEVSQELARRSGRSPQGFYMPMNLEHRSTYFDTAAATGDIATIIDSANFVELLRNQLVLQQAGCTFMAGMGGTFALPRQSGAASAAWVTEGNSASGSFQTVDQVQFTPKTLNTWTDISRKTIKQTAIDAEMFVRNDLAKVMAIEVDRAGLNGSGVGPEPLGLIQNSNIGQVPVGTNGGDPTWDIAVNLEGKLAAANALRGKVSYVTSGNGRSKLKRTPKIGTTYPVFLCENNVTNDYPVYMTNNVPTNLTKGTGTNLTALLIGNFQDLVIASWGAVDVIVDPYTGSKAGTVRIVMLYDMDINILHNGSFAVTPDMATT